MNDYKKDMGARIKRCRRERKITQEEIAEMLGVSVKHFSEVERGLTGLSVENLIKLSAILEQSLDYLIKGEPGISSWELLLSNLRDIPPEKHDELMELMRIGIRLAKGGAAREEQKTSE